MVSPELQAKSGDGGDAPELNLGDTYGVPVTPVSYNVVQAFGKSRGDRTPIELFLEGVAGWDGSLVRRCNS